MKPGTALVLIILALIVAWVILAINAGKVLKDNPELLKLAML